MVSSHSHPTSDLPQEYQTSQAQLLFYQEKPSSPVVTPEEAAIHHHDQEGSAQPLAYTSGSLLRDSREFDEASHLTLAFAATSHADTSMSPHHINAPITTTTHLKHDPATQPKPSEPPQRNDSTLISSASSSATAFILGTPSVSPSLPASTLIPVGAAATSHRHSFHGSPFTIQAKPTSSTTSLKRLSLQNVPAASPVLATRPSTASPGTTPARLTHTGLSPVVGPGRIVQATRGVRGVREVGMSKMTAGQGVQGGGGRQTPPPPPPPVGAVQPLMTAAPLVTPQTMPRDLLERYRVMDEPPLGAGGFGSVFAGVRRVDGLEVAVKVVAKVRIPSSSWAKDKDLGVVPMEVFILKNVRHPNVIAYRDYFKDEKHVYLLTDRFGTRPIVSAARGAQPRLHHPSRTGSSSSSSSTSTTSSSSAPTSSSPLPISSEPIPPSSPSIPSVQTSASRPKPAALSLLMTPNITANLMPSPSASPTASSPQPLRPFSSTDMSDIPPISPISLPSPSTAPTTFQYTHPQRSRRPSISSIRSTSSSTSLPLVPPSPTDPDMEEEDQPPVMQQQGKHAMDLFECIERRERLSEGQARFVFGQVANAVRYLHGKGVVHRDIKDENIIIDANLNVRLIDFGSATVEPVSAPHHTHQTFTGTITYASPEILRGERYKGKPADVWALGVLLYTILYGVAPFLSSEQAMHFPVRCDGKVGMLLGWMLMKEPGRRPSLEEVLKHPWMRKREEGRKGE
ncbi:kinase-like domain-containing protein [Chytridium lagenaria]|nr:kinase-like domain-containing protein [Chytridium lagenaria]